MTVAPYTMLTRENPKSDCTRFGYQISGVCIGVRSVAIGLLLRCSLKGTQLTGPSTHSLMSPRREQTPFEITIPDYRKRILLSLAKALILPPLLTSFAFRIACPSLALWYYIPFAFLSIPLSVVLRSHYTVWTQDRDAARLGAQPIPRVCGRWPGNLDVVLRMLKSFESDYVLQGFADLFHEYDCTTLNTRFFWDDQVYSRPSPRAPSMPPTLLPLRSSPWTRRSSGLWRIPASLTSKRAFYGTSACTSFPHPFFSPSQQALFFFWNSDKLLGTGLFNACV